MGGTVPNTWQIKKLGEVCDLIRGSEPGSASYFNKPSENCVQFIRVGDITGKVDNPKFVNKKLNNLTIVNLNDVLISFDGTPGVVVKGWNGVISSGIRVIRNVKPDILKGFLFYYLQTPNVQQIIKFYTTGVTILHASRAIPHIKIPLPPLPVQKAIVERLDAIKKAQELNDRQIALADELFQSLLYRELDPKKKNWKSKRLRDVAEITMGQSPPSTTYNMEGNGLPFFQGKFEFKEIYPIPIKFCSQPIRIAKKNDVLLSVRAPVGPVNLAPSECCIGRGLSAIRANVEKLDQFFLFYFMKLNENKTSFLGSGSTFTAIGRNRIEDIKIPLPPLSTQHQIVQKLQAVQEYKKKLIEQKQKLKELFESCLNKAMKGELVT